MDVDDESLTYIHIIKYYTIVITLYLAKKNPKKIHTKHQKYILGTLAYY